MLRDTWEQKPHKEPDHGDPISPCYFGPLQFFLGQNIEVHTFQILMPSWSAYRINSIYFRDESLYPQDKPEKVISYRRFPPTTVFT
jgi:hypothetical protein